MSKKKKVTLWFRVIRNEQGSITKKIFNHLEDGWNDKSYPNPKQESFSNQIAWKNDEWEKENKYMICGRVV